MEPKNTQKLIERYFENDLNADELAAFQQRLTEDAAFANDVQLEKELMDGIEAYGNEQLREQLEMMHLEEVGTGGTTEKNGLPENSEQVVKSENDGKVVKMVSRRWWLAAAVLLVGFVARWAFSESKPTPQQLYAIFAVHEFDFTEMGANDELLPEAERLLKEGKYAEALPVLEMYLQANPNDQDKKMAKGIALLETGKYGQALEMFKEIGQENPLLESEAKWYMALNYLKNGDIENCKNTLIEIPSESARKKDVIKLLEYLK